MQGRGGAPAGWSVGRRAARPRRPGARALPVASFARADRDWEAGEVIEWATGAYATPDHVLSDFLDSPPHRRILLSDAYDQVGIGVVGGTPTHGPDGVTVVIDLGHRSPRTPTR